MNPFIEVRQPAYGWWHRPAGMPVLQWKESLIQAGRDARRHAHEQHRLALQSLAENAEVARIYGAKGKPAPRPAPKPTPRPASRPASKPSKPVYPKPSPPEPWARATPKLDKASRSVRQLLEGLALVKTTVRNERNQAIGQSYWLGGAGEPIFIPTREHDRSQRIAAMASAARGPDRFAAATCYREWAVSNPCAM